MNYSDSSNSTTSKADLPSSHKESVDPSRLLSTVNEILIDMDQGACAETITQTVQIITLANGKKAAVRVLVTTDSDSFM